MRIECPICGIDNEKANLIPISTSNEEYQLSLKTNDGTRKWYTCIECHNTFCKDKIRNIWQYSPKTYTKLVSEGLISNKLGDD